MHDPPYILLVDDEPRIAEMLAAAMPQFVFEPVRTGRQARIILDETPPDVMMIDLMLPDVDGIRLLGEIHARYPAIPLVVITGHTAMERVLAAMRSGASDFIAKPFRSEVVEASIMRALEQRRRAEQEEAYVAQLEEHAARLEHMHRKVLAKESTLLVGQLMQGLINDVANPLSVIRVNASLMEMRSHLEPDAAKRVSAIKDALKRIQHTVDLIQTFSFEPDTVEPVDVPELVQDTVDELLNTGRMTMCHVSVLLPRHRLPPISVRLEQIWQALRSILLHAEEVASRHPEAACQVEVSVDRSGPDVSITVSSHVHGAPTTATDRLFEPLVTDGDPSVLAGAGLALFMARNVVEANGGRLEVSHERGGLASVRLFFDAAEA